MDHRFDAVDRRVEAVGSRVFSVMGLQIMTLLAILGGLFTIIAKLF